jgi:hypothetical protein
MNMPALTNHPPRHLRLLPCPLLPELREVENGKPTFPDDLLNDVNHNLTRNPIHIVRYRIRNEANVNLPLHDQSRQKRKKLVDLYSLSERVHHRVILYPVKLGLGLVNLSKRLLGD